MKRNYSNCHQISWLGRGVSTLFAEAKAKCKIQTNALKKGQNTTSFSSHSDCINQDDKIKSMIRKIQIVMNLHIIQREKGRQINKTHYSRNKKENNY